MKAAAARCAVLGDVALGDGRTLRVATLHEPDGTATLILSVGTGEGPSWREDPAEGLVVPASAVPGLLEALSLGCSSQVGGRLPGATHTPSRRTS
jgi:hypothetical protein